MRKYQDLAHNKKGKQLAGPTSFNNLLHHYFMALPHQPECTVHQYRQADEKPYLNNRRSHRS